MILKPIRGVQLNRTHPLSKGLVGCWIFNEAMGGLSFDLTGNGNNGIFKNGVSWGGGGLDLTSVGGYVDCGDNTSLDLSKLTLEAWVKRYSFGTLQSVMAKGNVASNADLPYALYFDPNDNITLSIGDDTAYSILEGGAIADTNWHHIAATVDGSTMAIYIDGILDVSAPQTIFPFMSNEILTIGSLTASSYFFDGFIDSIRIYNCRKSAYEVAWLCREPYAAFSHPRGL